MLQECLNIIVYNFNTSPMNNLVCVSFYFYLNFKIFGTLLLSYDDIIIMKVYSFLYQNDIFVNYIVS